jgi:integrase/recombinase XerD
LVQSGSLRHQVFFNHVVGNDWSIKHIPYQKKPKTLPIVLNRKEVTLLLSVITNPKYHAIAATLYGAGLRISECLNLQICDIDSENMVITVRDGKGRKDRKTVLSESLLSELRKYYRKSLVKPSTYLFPNSKNVQKPFSKRQTQSFIRTAGLKARIGKAVAAHSLRHSFATPLLEDGVNLRKIQVILGHKSLKTTEVYTHLTKDFLDDVTSPLDKLDK